MTVFLDTNVLLYAVLDSADDAAKRGIAKALVRRDDCALSMQVLNEFVVQAIHAKRPNRLPLDLAKRYCLSWRRFPVQETTFALFESGLAIMRDGGFSFWDAMIVAAARAQGCELLYSEDMQDGRIIGGMRIVNPFR